MKSSVRKVVVGVSGSIAAYKAAELIRLLVKRRFEVRVVMTSAASKFISSLTFQALSGNPVLTSVWDEETAEGIGHIELADWADAMVIAPASANTLAKLACGICDNALLATALATKAPVLVAPAMNVNMWDNPATQANVNCLLTRGVEVVSPDIGPLACGWTGAGRLASPEEIFWRLSRATNKRDLQKKHVLITAGPTREEIDPVRYLTNRSSGRMGVALALDAYRRGAKVTLVRGPLGYNPFIPAGIDQVSVTSANQMRDIVLAKAAQNDIVIMAAAVSDFRPLQAAKHKLKKSDGLSRIDLAENNDIIAELGSQRDGRSPFLVAFSVETNDDVLTVEARRKLDDKGVDLLVANSAKVAFDNKTNQVFILSKDKVVRVANAHKLIIARKILNQVVRKIAIGQ